MRKFSNGLLAGLAFLLVIGSAKAQNAVVQYKATATTPGSISVTPSTPLPVTGSFSAGGFVPSLAYGTLTATASSSSSTALPTNTGTVAFQNQNSVAVSCTLASGSATATTNEIIVPAGSTVFVGTTGYSNTACINQTGSASNVIVMAGGSGLGTGFGGGGSGSGTVAQGTGGASAWLVTGAGGSFPVTGTFWQATQPVSGTFYQATQPVSIASAQVASGAYASGAFAVGAGTDGWDVTLGTKADAAWTSGNGTAISILKNIANAANSSVPVTVNGTVAPLTGLTPGTLQTSTIVAANVDATSKGGVAYGAMANFGTTPGAVKADSANVSLFIGTAVNSSANPAFAQLTAGSAIVGKVGIDQTTPGTTNGVQLPATQAGGVALGQAVKASSVPVTLASDQPSVPVTPLSTTAAGVTQSDPCTFGAKTNLPITSNTSALTQIIAASGSTKVYICSLAIISASAEWITFNTGTGTNCGSSTAGLIGGTTVGTNGLSLAANGGLTLGNGGGTIALTGAGGEVCVALSGTTYVTGNLTYVQQ